MNHHLVFHLLVEPLGCDMYFLLTSISLPTVVSFPNVEDTTAAVVACGIPHNFLEPVTLSFSLVALGTELALCALSKSAFLGLFFL